jgi:hypothetical protein
METWYKVTLSDQDIIAGKGLQLQNEYTMFHIQDWQSRRDALMLDSGDALDHTYYFSPGAVRLALPLILRWGGKPCPVPSPKGLAKLVGSTEALRVAFAPPEDKS